MTDGLRDRLQAALYESDLVDLSFAGDLADVLLSTVRAEQAAYAAAELRAVAERLRWRSGVWPPTQLHDRADELEAGR